MEGAGAGADERRKNGQRGGECEGVMVGRTLSACVKLRPNNASDLSATPVVLPRANAKKRALKHRSRVGGLGVGVGLGGLGAGS